ncbi:hypothetical protein [Roseicyclus amphidinii]|uniref:hypothetical protein n=1 Tax=Roseicyclus amphidinii TaxID=3034232 RepID=UPI0024E0955F|nr:hypothetical protein [Roseicyclus sp. Amp-Y-6]
MTPTVVLMSVSVKLSQPEILRLVTGERHEPVIVGRVPKAYAAQVGALHTHVWLSRETLLKQLARHPDIPLATYENLDWVLSSSMIYGDRRAGRFHLVAPVERLGSQPKHFKVTIKNVRNSERLFLLSAHDLRSSSLRKLIAASEKIRPPR